jgi:hypothetical protein
MRRKRFPKTVESEVLFKCRRRCALCFGLDGDTTEKEGQVAHIDRNPANAVLENAAFLCTKHHSRYDSRSKQTKGFVPDELRSYQRILYDYLASEGAWPDASRSIGYRMSRKVSKVGVSLEVYDRRLPIYRTTTQFVRAVLKDLNPELQEILKFASETEEALFLFDEAIAEYLVQIFKGALRLHTIRLMLTQVTADQRTLLEEDTKLAVWFSEQFAEIRTRLAPFLQLGR